MSLIELRNVKKTYGIDDSKVEALKCVNLNVDKGEMLAIMGPSGSGKSTLLNIIGLLDKATEGNYFFEGKATEKLSDKQLSKHRNAHIGFVVQNFALIDDYTVFQNIKVPLDYTKLTSKEKKQRIETLLDKLGISSKREKLPKQLSGGQNQRVAIARALVNKPDIILADEPTGALDRKTGEDVMNILKDLNKDGSTIIIITHDKRVADMCKRVIYLEDGILKESAYE